MNDCYKNIIGIRSSCEVDNGAIPSSGFYISDYPGITLKGAANVADGNEQTGDEFLNDLRTRAMKRLQADILRYINQNFKVNEVTKLPWSTTKEVRTSVVAPGVTTDKRGIVLTKKKPNCRLTKVHISTITIAVPTTQTVTLKIADATFNEVTTYEDLICEGGFENEFQINKSFSGNEIQIYLPGDVSVYSSKPHCNCGGESSSDCINVLGMNNSTLSKEEGFGITAMVQCKCDFSDLLCDLSMDQLIGQAAFELIGAMFYDEQLKSTRFNWMTMYDEETIAKQSQMAFSDYNGLLNDSLKGLKGYIERADKCGCIDCNGYSLKYNI